jgi:hypothetical protein
MNGGNVAGEGIILGSGYLKPRNKFGNNPLQVIAVVEEEGEVDFLEPYAADQLEQDVLDREITIGGLVRPDDRRSLDRYRVHLHVAARSLEEVYTSIELAPGYAKLLGRVTTAANVNEPADKQAEKETSKMNASKIMNRVKDDVVNSVKTAGKLEFVGRTGLLAAKEEVQVLFPNVPKELLESPLSDAAIALFAEVLIAAFASENKLASTASEAMLTVAVQNGLGKLQVPELAARLVSKIGAENIKSLIDEE